MHTNYDYSREECMEDEKARCASMLPVRATLGYFFHLEQLHIIIKSENKMIEMPIIVIFVKAVNASFFFLFSCWNPILK